MNTKITILELADLMAESTSTSSRMCELFIRELFATVSQALIDGESVKIKGIGTFKITRVKARKSTNVNTGESNELSSHNRLTFTPEKSLAEAVNHPFAQFETVILDDEVTDEKLAEIDEQYPSMLIDNSDEPLPLPPSEIDVPSPRPVEIPITVEPQDVELPQPPDMPVPPPPDDLPMDDDEPAPVSQPNQQPSDTDKAPVNDIHDEKTVEVTTVAKTEEQVEPKVEPVKAEPVKAEPVKVEVTPTPEEPKVAQPAEEPVKRRPMLVGIPIDGPSQPVPSEEPAEETQANRHFYRPEPRNAYTPTPEQIEEASRKNDYRWLWALLCLLTAGVLIWLIARGGSENPADQPGTQVVAADTLVNDNDSIPEVKAEIKPEAKPEAKPEVKAEAKTEVKAEAKTEVKPEAKPEVKPETKSEEKPEAKAPASTEKTKEVTDVVTSQIVLTTLAEKHYGSPWFWVYIYEENLNRGIIDNPNNIRPGTRVVIPPASKYGINPKDKASLKKAQRKSWEYLKDY